MKVKWILLLAAVGAVLFACKKDETFQLEINGTITDGESNSALNGVEVTLLHSEVAGGTFGNVFNTIATTATNSSGYYAFEFDRSNTIEYKIEAAKLGYFDHEEIFPSEDVDTDAAYVHSFQLLPKATIQTTWVNTSPETDDDEITFFFMNMNSDCACCSSSQTVLTGQEVNESSTCDVVGNTWVRYFYSVEKMSGSYDVIDSIYCPILETTELFITY